MQKMGTMEETRGRWWPWSQGSDIFYFILFYFLCGGGEEAFHHGHTCTCWVCTGMGGHGHGHMGDGLIGDINSYAWVQHSRMDIGFPHVLMTLDFKLKLKQVFASWRFVSREKCSHVRLFLKEREHDLSIIELLHCRHHYLLVTLRCMILSWALPTPHYNIDQWIRPWIDSSS